MNRIEQGSFEFPIRPTIMAYATVVGKKEGEGPLGKKFDKVYTDNMLGEDSWEKAESRLQKETTELCISKSGKRPEEYDAIFSGDLLNQCIASTFGLRELRIPFVGMYGACSTMASTIITAATFLQAGCVSQCIATTSSHFSSSERQFRNPLQYGGQRTPTAQWTVTGSGSVALGTGEGNVHIERATVGMIEDLGIKDANNMGAAMAPAACSTIKRHLSNFNAAPKDYDLILTGDLGFVGSTLLDELLKKDGISLGDKHHDAGMMIFDRERQDVHAGGSGCGCSASVLCGCILPQLSSGELNRVLFVATGALMSPTSSQQGESIPGVAHAVEIVSD
ncbi:MAG: stage V sporulation protein AD [Clostridia bacterium]|nr:stage V sporulation protein AD [Clostridia bacterium]